MSDQQRIRTSFHCTIKALTPLHVGSGEVLKRGFDFLADKSEIRMISHVRLFHYLNEIGFQNIEPFIQAIEEKRPLDWLKEKGFFLDDMEGQLRMYWPDKPDKIRAQIRDGVGNPIVPGSSLKGALRTAILKRLSDEDGKKTVNATISRIKNKPKPLEEHEQKEADNDICDTFLGNDPTNSLMRTLSIGDFSFSQADVSLQKVEVSREVSNNTMKLKPKPRSDQPMQITVEKIKENSSSQGRISFDKFLYARDEKTDKFCLGFKAEINREWLISAIRELTNDFIGGELQYLSDKKGTHISGLLAFYRDLQQKSAGLGADEAFLNLGWGIGWRGTTGELVDNNDLSADNHKLRKNLKLATNHLDFPFPKSRRIAISGKTIQPMGWVRLAFSPVAKEG